MTICGIVVEYNPFHNGHLYQIQEIKRQLNPDAIFVVMSGQFTQRGTPCITDKHTRSQMALANGVDMVFELPTPFATSSAEFFASAAISLLDKTHMVTHLSFGCETPKLHLLSLIASTLIHEPNDVSELIKAQLHEGISYPRARQHALIDYLGRHVTPEDQPFLEPLLSNPNNILGIHYLKALQERHSPIKAFPIERKVAQYHDPTIAHRIASATAIRTHLKANDLPQVTHAMPKANMKLLLEHAPPIIDLDHFSDLLHYRLIFSNEDALYALWDIPKNLCLSILNASKTYFSITEIINAVTSKTYSRASVTRAILRILLAIQKEFVDKLIEEDFIPYIRVLACNPQAKPLLGQLCKRSSVPVITQFNKYYQTCDTLSRSLLDLEIQATKLYALKKEKIHLSLSDFTKSIFTPPNT